MAVLPLLEHNKEGCNHIGDVHPVEQPDRAQYQVSGQRPCHPLPQHLSCCLAAHSPRLVHRGLRTLDHVPIAVLPGVSTVCRSAAPTWMGALDIWALPTKRTIWARAVSDPTRVALSCSATQLVLCLE